MVVSVGSGVKMSLRGLKMGFNRLLFFSPACGVHLQREKSHFYPCFACLLCSSFACLLSLPLRVTMHIQEKRPFLWVALSLDVLFLPLWALIAKDCKRLAVSACYCYFPFAGGHRTHATRITTHKSPFLRPVATF